MVLGDVRPVINRLQFVFELKKKCVRRRNMGTREIDVISWGLGRWQLVEKMLNKR